jgi:hypothetical protein
MDASLLNPMAMNGGRGVNTERIRNELLNDFGGRANDPVMVPVVRSAGVHPQGVPSDVRWVGGGGRAQDVRPNAPGGRSHAVQISGSVRTLSARPNTGTAVVSGRAQYTGRTTNPRLPGYQPSQQQPKYSYEMSPEELEEQRALLNLYSQRQQQQQFGARPNVRVQTVLGTMAPYQPHPSHQVGYAPHHGGRRTTPRPVVYEDEEEEEDWYAADGDRMGPPYSGRTGALMGGGMFDDDGFGLAMGGFGGDGFGDPDELWEEMTGRMDQMFDGMSLGGGYDGRLGRGAGDGYGIH